MGGEVTNPINTLPGGIFSTPAPLKNSFMNSINLVRKSGQYFGVIFDEKTVNSGD